jgi:hypothetical protein
MADVRAERDARVTGGRGPPPWQFLVRAAAIVTGLTLLLVVDVHGVAFYVAWSLIGLALISEAAATLVHRHRAGRDG